MNRPRYDVPPELTNLLLEFTVNVMIERPSDLVEYAARYFAGLRDERQRSGSSGRPPAIAENDEAIYSDEDEPMPPPPQRKPKGASKSTEIKPAGSRSVPLARSADVSSPPIL